MEPIFCCCCSNMKHLYSYPDACSLKSVSCVDYSECRVNAINNMAECACPTLHDCSTADAKPVCGSNGLTYQSMCHFRVGFCGKKLGVSVAHVGACGRLLVPGIHYHYSPVFFINGSLGYMQ